MEQHEQWMGRALELAERGRGHVEPNPLVGTVLVKEGKLIGAGWHEKFGAAHAEVNALAQAGAAARGSTCYVTLEPCCHQGKTPPCTEALIRAGVRHVQAALEDPFPQVAGRGAQELRAARIGVEFGLCAELARRQNAPYLKLLSTGRPYVHAKWAMTLDGKIATRTGDSRWISNEASRKLAHELRGRMDAILVGIGTVLADDPLLTARPPGPRSPLRVVLDSRAHLPLTSQLVATAREHSTLLVTSTHTPEEVLLPLRSAGLQVLAYADDASGRIDFGKVLDDLGKQRRTNLLVEGGSEVLGSFFDQDAIDEVHVFIAPRLAGGTAAKGPIGGRGIEQMMDALELKDREVRLIDGDIYVHGRR